MASIEEGTDPSEAAGAGGGLQVSFAEVLETYPDAALALATKRVAEGRLGEARAMVAEGVLLGGESLAALAEGSSRAEREALAKDLVRAAGEAFGKTRARMWMALFATGFPEMPLAALPEVRPKSMFARSRLAEDDFPDLFGGGELQMGSEMSVPRMAALFGAEAALRRLLAMDREAALGEDGFGPSALHWACWSSAPGSLACVEALLEAGADPNLQVRMPETLVKSTMDLGTALSAAGDFAPIGAAAMAGASEKIEALLAAGADPNARERSAGSSPLTLACLFGNAEAARLLLEKIDWDAPGWADRLEGAKDELSGRCGLGLRAAFESLTEGAGAETAVLTLELFMQARAIRSEAVGDLLAEAGADCVAVRALLSMDDFYDENAAEAARSVALAFAEARELKMACAPGVRREPKAL